MILTGKKMCFGTVKGPTIKIWEMMYLKNCIV